MTRHAQILATGRYVPAKAVPNAWFDDHLGKPVSQWLIDNTGIANRHVMADDETTSDLALHAARQALERAGLSADQLDLIILATDTPDYISPATATVLQYKLGATRAGTFDVNCACAGFVTALDTAARHILTDPDLHHILVVGVYAMTRYVDYSDQRTCTLFADGAGAVIVGAGDQPGWLAGKLIADGSYHDALGIYTGGVTTRRTPPDLNDGIPRVRFVRKFPASFNAENWPPLIHSTLAKAGLTVDDVDLFLFTQLNLNTIKQMMEIIGQPLEKTHWIMHKWGYTGSACIPMALDDVLESADRAPRPGAVVLMIASGGGISMAASLWRWTAPPQGA
jgi:3-oxoacyl-[acyl-carrier-protein] synthase-3